MATATVISLSKNDRAVLGALFDPENALQSSCQINESTPEPYSRAVMSEIRQREREAVKHINEQAPSTSKILQTIAQLDSLISLYPLYSSAWPNRAQATRMLFDLAEARSNPDKMQSVYRDLTSAIQLAKPKDIETVSSANAKVLASAHTHKGYILWRASQTEAPIGLLDDVEQLKGLSKERLEELASNDLSLGGRYGNQDAQKLAVICNPYAKLCGSIVREALQKDIEDWRNREQIAA